MISGMSRWTSFLCMACAKVQLQVKYAVRLHASLTAFLCPSSFLVPGLGMATAAFGVYLAFDMLRGESHDSHHGDTKQITAH